MKFFKQKIEIFQLTHGYTKNGMLQENPDVEVVDCEQ